MTEMNGQPLGSRHIRIGDAKPRIVQGGGGAAGGAGYMMGGSTAVLTRLVLVRS